jgi:hypothetical protein
MAAGLPWIFSGHYADYHMDNRGYTAHPQSGPEIIDKVTIFFSYSKVLVFKTMLRVSSARL